MKGFWLYSIHSKTILPEWLFSPLSLVETIYVKSQTKEELYNHNFIVTFTKTCQKKHTQVKVTQNHYKLIQLSNYKFCLQ